MQDLQEVFDGVKDPRRSNATRHDLHEMLVIGLLSAICGGEGCSDMALFGRSKEAFLRGFLRPGHGIPSHDAFSDLFNALDPDGLNAALPRLAGGWGERLGGVVAIDGKALRRSFGDAAARSPLHLVHAFAAESGVLLGQVRVPDRSNEITALPALLELLDLRGMTVTADAMHTQRVTAERVTAAGGSYVLAPRGNQGTLNGDVRDYMEDPQNAENIHVSGPDIDKGHGRIEIRRASVCHDVGRLQEKHGWPGLAAFGAVRAVRETRKGTSEETRFFIMSEAMPPERLLKTVRSHWAVENSLHWVLDVTMNEDAQRNRTGNGPQNLAMMRRMALNLARATPDGSTRWMRPKLKKAAWDDRFLLKLVLSAAKIGSDAEKTQVQKR